MRLFISNFKKIFVIVGVFLVLFVGYNAFVVLAKPQINAFQNQWQSNMVFAQDYLYTAPPPQCLIVGSSLAARLESNLLASKHIYNLAFGGGSALTGLNIIREHTQRTGAIPHTIYIEENIVIIRGVDNAMLDTLFDPIGYRLRRYIPALQERYAPINLVLSLVKKRFGKSEAEKLAHKRDERMYRIILERSIQSYQKELVGYESKLANLHELLEYFENLGTKIVFFQMPIDSELASLRQPLQQHEILQIHFPQYTFLPSPSHNDYTTNDGVHLIKESSMRFTQDFMQFLSCP